MTFPRRFRGAAAVLAMLALTAGSVLLPQSVRAEDSKAVKPARPKVALFAGGGKDDLKVLRQTLEKVPSMKFDSDELKFSDFERDGGVFTSFFTIELTDRAKTDVGAIAKAVASAKTSKKDKAPPATFVVIRYRPDSVKTKQLREALAKVKGVQADKSWAGDVNLWVSLDGSGQGKLSEITRALREAGVKFRDPITDTDQS